MSLLHDTVNLLNLDGTLTTQKQLLQFPGRWIHFHDIPHPSRYCEPQALKQINERIQTLDHGITFIGNGNYHYISYLLLSKIDEDFTLILFDHHTDMMESPQMISCGSWVSYALETYPKLKKVIIVGSGCEAQPLLEKYQAKVTLFAPGDISLSRLEKEIPTPVAYISIDKDVLRPEDAVTNWDQGEMSLQQLLQILQKILDNKQVIGVDVCGELPVSPAEQFKPQYAEAIRKNERTNLLILKTLLTKLWHNAMGQRIKPA